jgi:hypothetical protein
MSRSEGVKALEAELAFVEQWEATAIDVISLKCWCNLTARKRSKAVK